MATVVAPQSQRMSRQRSRVWAASAKSKRVTGQDKKTNTA